MKVVTNAFWLSFCRVLADLLSFVLFAVISRTFGPSGTGEYSYAFAVGTLVALISTSGFEDYGIRQYARTAVGERAALWRDLLASQCAQLVLGLLAFGGFAVAGAIRTANLVVVAELSIYVIGWAASRTFFIPAMAAQAMVRPAFTDLACRLAAILGALGWALLGHPSLPLLLAGFPVAGVVLATLALRNAAQHGALLRPGRSLGGILHTMRGTLPFAGSDILNQFYARADVLLIAYFLGNAQVGLYATDIKFVEVGLLPLILLGTASYPLLSAHAARDPSKFALTAQDFIRLLLFFAGWLALAIHVLIPLLIVPLFGTKFAPAVPLLPYVAAFALLKGGEAAFYRLLYSTHRQNLYFGSLLAGTVIIWSLNYLLIPQYGLTGAIVAAIVSTVVIDAICIFGLSRRIKPSYVAMTAGRLLLTLGSSALLVAGARRLGAGPWTTALVGCALYPVVGAGLGLLPHPRRSHLLQRTEVLDPGPAASPPIEAN